MTRLLRAYVGIARRVGALFLLLVATAGASYVVVYPLWLFATSNRRGYTVFVLCLGAVGISLAATLRLRRAFSRDPNYLRARLVPAVGRAALLLALVVLVPVVVWLYGIGFLIAAIPLSAALLMGIGVYAHRR